MKYRHPNGTFCFLCSRYMLFNHSVVSIKLRGMNGPLSFSLEKLFFFSPFSFSLRKPDSVSMVKHPRWHLIRYKSWNPLLVSIWGMGVEVLYLCSFKAMLSDAGVRLLSLGSHRIVPSDAGISILQHTSSQCLRRNILMLRMASVCFSFPKRSLFQKCRITLCPLPITNAQQSRQL